MRAYSPERFRELFLYIAERMAKTQHRGQGRIKLIKLIWLSDFESYLRLGDAITGVEYKRDRLGPSPPEELIQTRAFNPDTEFAWKPGFDKQKLPDVKRPPEAGLFEARELDLVNEVVDRYRTWTADALVNDIAHKHPGYKLVKVGEVVPYDSVFISTRPPSEATIHRARALVGGGDSDIPF